MSQSQSNTPTAEWMETIPKDKKIGVIVPLYGYWIDSPKEQLDWQTLSTFLTNLKSHRLKTFITMVVEAPRLSKNVQNVIIGKQQGGGIEVLDVDKYSTYGDYLQEGLSYLLEETDCEYIVVANPWIALKDNSLDQLAEKLNMAGMNLISGIDLKKLKWGILDGIPADQFDTFNFNPPMDLVNKDFDNNFWGMTRQRAQTFKIDPNFKTIYFQGADLWGNTFNAGLSVISSQYLPFYSFDVDFKEIESQQLFEEDKQYFIQKWRFDPDVKRE